VGDAVVVAGASWLTVNRTLQRGAREGRAQEGNQRIEDWVRERRKRVGKETEAGGESGGTGPGVKELWREREERPMEG
jgi:hypothetical protein